MAYQPVAVPFGVVQSGWSSVTVPDSYIIRIRPSGLCVSYFSSRHLYIPNHSITQSFTTSTGKAGAALLHR